MHDTWAGKAKTGRSENWSLVPGDMDTRASKPYKSFSYVPAIILKLLGSDSLAFPLFFGRISSALTPVGRGDPFIRFAEIGTSFCFLDAGALPIAFENSMIWLYLSLRA